MSLPAWTHAVVTNYCRTGDLIGALDAVGLQPSQYYAALESNASLAERMRLARRCAQQVASLRILSRALGPNRSALAPEIAAAVLEDLPEGDGHFVRRLAIAVARIKDASRGVGQ